MKSKKVNLIITATTLMIVTVFLFFAGKVKAEIMDEAIIVKTIFVSSTTVPLSDITSVDYVTNFNIGVREFGLGTFKLEAGNYKNTEFGKYKLYSYKNVDSYIIVHHGSNILVFNQSNVQDTERLYQQLKR